MAITDRTPNLAVYRYRVTASYIVNNKKYPIDMENVKTVVIDYDFDKINMPF